MADDGGQQLSKIEELRRKSSKAPRGQATVWQIMKIQGIVRRFLMRMRNPALLQRGEVDHARLAVGLQPLQEGDAHPSRARMVPRL